MQILVSIKSFGPLAVLFSTLQFLFPKQVQIYADFEKRFHWKLIVEIVHGHLLLKMEV